jgi:hypothetical protein
MRKSVSPAFNAGQPDPLIGSQRPADWK